MNLKTFIEAYGDSFPYMVTMVDQNLPDQPLVYVNKYFQDLTGYESKEILGRNCRFLQNDKLDVVPKKKLRDAIHERHPVCQDIINFKKNGELFYNRLVMIPFRTNGDRYYLGLQNDIPAEKFKPENEIPDNVLTDRMIKPLTALLGMELIADSRFNNEFQVLIGNIQSFVLGL